MSDQRTKLLLVDQTSFSSLAPKLGSRSPYMDHQLIESRLQDLDEGLKEIAKRVAGGIGKVGRAVGRAVGKAASFVKRKLTGRPSPKKSRNPMSPRGGHNVRIGASCPSPRTKTSVDGAPRDAKRCNDQTDPRQHHY